MYTRAAPTIVDPTLAAEASALIRSCVHCGFCLPACPTYRVTGSELDSPRGRIYLIKDMLERGAASPAAQLHLDRCLTCRACETACPSGVQYGRLADLGRELIERRPPAPRSWRERVLRQALVRVATRRALFTPLVRMGQSLRPILPRRLRTLLPPGGGEATKRHERAQVGGHDVRAEPALRDLPAINARVRRVALLEGCVQPGLAPGINASAARVLGRLGISVTQAKAIGCCGALDHHLGRAEASLSWLRRNVDASERLLRDGCEAIVSTASGCGVFAKDYGHLARRESPALQQLARRVAAGTRDLAEVVDPEALADLVRGSPAHGSPMRLRVAWQAPCSLQHGQRAATAGKVEAILRAAGCELLPVRDATLCCGSAGTYSLLQPDLSQELRQRKLDTLLAEKPDVIATANIGCLEHLRQASAVPVRHWVEIVDAQIGAADRG